MSQQLSFYFEPSLVSRFSSMRELMAHITYGEMSLGRMAVILDVAPSNLSEMLSGGRKFDTDLPERYMQKTGDTRPAAWMAGKYLQDTKAVRDQAMAQLADMMPQLEGLLKAAQGGGS